MIQRPELLKNIGELLGQRSVLWISGVRRVGKTTLCSMVSDAVYLDCELPSTRAQLEHPEHFWRQHDGGLVILDEIHRLMDPSNILKIAADHFPQTKIIATGSSTLAAKRKFKDTLTDRKRDLWVPPLLVSELVPHGGFDADRRLLHGGLPPAYLADTLDDSFFAEWIDSFWAKDIQELFVIEKKTAFLKLAELILRQSGQIFEASSFAGPCEISRQTVSNYLEALATTLFAMVVRPYSNKRANDIVAAPKVYGFDTGFVCYSRGWETLRPEDRGNLIEHLVLSELIHQFGKRRVYYWRDKQKHEVDFVIKPGRGEAVHAIECKSNYQNFKGRNLAAFRNAYPAGNNYLVAGNVFEPMPLSVKGQEVTALPLGYPIPVSGPDNH